MRTKWIVVVSYVLAVCTLSEPALAVQSDYEPGTKCVSFGRPVAPYYPLSYGPGGATNNVSVGFNVYCPLRWQGAASALSTATILIAYRDLSTTDVFQCFLNVFDSAGNKFVGTGKGSCSTSGGCTPGTPSFTSPVGTHTRISLTGMSGSWTNETVQCWIPAPSGGQASSLGSVYFGY